MDLLMGKSEDVINSTFQVILYIFIFKMINVYNIARCDTVQELKKQNGRVNILAGIIIFVFIVIQVANIGFDITLYLIETQEYALKCNTDE